MALHIVICYAISNCQKKALTWIPNITIMKTAVFLIKK